MSPFALAGPPARPRRHVLLLATLLLTSLAGCSSERTDSVFVAADTLLPVNGTHLWVHREGRGEPALVVHGGPVLDQTYLRDHLTPLDSSLELVYFDQRLSGRSDGVVDSASVRLDTLVADIEALRQALGLERVHVIAHSWGGLLALEYAERYPDRVRSLILVSPMPPTTALWQQEQQALAASLEPADTAGLGALQRDPAYQAQEPAAVEAALKLSFRSQFHDPSQVDALRFHIEPDYAERSRQFGYMLPDLLDYDVTGDLERVRVPVLLLFGADEPGARIGGKVLAEGLPQARLVTIPDAGHFSFVEQRDAFFQAVRGFLAGVVGGG